MAEKQNEEGSRIYWIIKHSWQAIRSFARRHRIFFILLLLLILVVGFLTRAFSHDFVLGVRKYFGLLLIGSIFLAFVIRKIRNRSKWFKVPITTVLVLFFVTAPKWGDEIHQYLSMYYRYRTLKVIELKGLPETSFERIQPLNSIYSLAMEIITDDSKSPASPDFVRIGNDYRWTMAIEPAYTINRLVSGVQELFNIPATTPSPEFSSQNLVKVSFPTGQNLLIGRKSKYAVIKTFGLWRFLNYEPADVIHCTDDKGEWVQVVSLIRWKGIIFPRPEFGGIQLIRQQEESLISDLKLLIFGAGQWIKPNGIKNYPFLLGQNILSPEVSRFIANSFRFQNGFLAPFPGYHRGDIRIPDLPEDVNQQPYTLFFHLKSQGGFDGLYHYFCLEPYDVQKQGLSTSLFIPADGSGKILVIRHYQRGDSLIGVSAVGPKIVESRKYYDWRKNRPVEHRPYIKTIGGRTRFFWLTTVVTMKEGKSGDDKFIAGAIPDVVITDAAYKIPIWVDPLKPNKWIEQLQKDLSAVWVDNQFIPKEGKKDDIRPVLPNPGGDVRSRATARTAEAHQ